MRDDHMLVTILNIYMFTNGEVTLTVLFQTFVSIVFRQSLTEQVNIVVDPRFWHWILVNSWEKPLREHGREVIYIIFWWKENKKKPQYKLLSSHVLVEVYIVTKRTSPNETADTSIMHGLQDWTCPASLITTVVSDHVILLCKAKKPRGISLNKAILFPRASLSLSLSFALSH